MNESKLKKNKILLVVLFASGAAIYLLPYLRNFYYEAFRDAFGMTNAESGLCGTYFGFFGLLSYIIGGVIADKISIKILIPGSMIVSGALGLYLLTSPTPFVVAIIHGIWGITSLMTFWPALVKALRLVGNSNEQGRVFGIFEGGRGVTNAVVYAIAASLFAAFLVNGNEMTGIRPIIILYSVIPIVLGLLNIVLLRNIKTDSNSDSSGISFKALKNLLKNPGIWLECGIIFCAYAVNMSNYYIAPYATAAFGASLLAAAIMSASSQYIRPFASVGSGILADRFNSSKIMLAGNIIALVGLLIIFFTPIGTSIIPVIAGLLIVFAAMYITQSMHFAIMEEINVPAEASGTAVGLCCTLGYLPEVICPFYAGKILDSFPEGDLGGYRLIFLILMGVTVLGIFLTLLWIRRTKVRRAELDASRMQMLEAKKANKTA